MLLPGFQKLLQFLQPQQLLEWTQGSLTPAQMPHKCRLPHAHTLPPRAMPSALGLLGALEILESHSGATVPEMSPSATIILD